MAKFVGGIAHIDACVRKIRFPVDGNEKLLDVSDTQFSFFLQCGLGIFLRKNGISFDEKAR